MARPKIPDSDRRDRLPLRIKLSATERDRLEAAVKSIQANGQPVRLAPWARETLLLAADHQLAR